MAAVDRPPRHGRPADDEPAPAWPAAAALIGGAALWWVGGALAGRREPWDSGAYWVVVYPLAVALAAWLGWRFPKRPRLWALFVFVGQFVGMVLRNGELGGLWPLGLGLFAVLALPAVAVAARLARRSPHAGR